MLFERVTKTVIIPVKLEVKVTYHYEMRLSEEDVLYHEPVVDDIAPVDVQDDIDMNFATYERLVIPFLHEEEQETE